MIHIDHLDGQAVHVDTLYPSRAGGWSYHWNAETGSLTVTVANSEPHSARILRIRAVTTTEGSR